MLHTLQNALPIVAAALGRRFGVAVGVGGTEACTDGRQIQIPDVGDDPAARALAWGYLAHEAGHVRYTDFDAYEAGTREGPLQTILQNRIEDVRIERALAPPYPGTRHTIGAVLGRLLADGRLRVPTPEDHPAAVLAGYLLLTLRVTVLEQTLFLAEARQAEASLRAVFPPPFIRRLRALMAAVPTLTSTAEAVSLARRIRALIEEEAQAELPQGAADEGQPGAGASGACRTEDPSDADSPAHGDRPADGDQAASQASGQTDLRGLALGRNRTQRRITAANRRRKQDRTRAPPLTQMPRRTKGPATPRSLLRLRRQRRWMARSAGR